MKKCITALSVLMISFFISACSGKGDSSVLFTVGGVVSGLTGTVVIQNNGDDDLTIMADGPFSFPTGTAPGSPYTVTVKTNPNGQTCIVSKGTGTILISSVTNVSVDCFKRGGLDLAFNSPYGFVVQDNAAGGNGDDLGKALALDSQGRILSVGSSTNSAGNTDMVLWRFNADGTPDTTFNGSGIVVHDNAAGGAGDDEGNAIAVDNPFGGILVTGSSTTTGGTTEMTVWKFKQDGTLDTDFSVDGIVSAATGTGNNAGNAIAIDFDHNHKVLVTGSTTSTAGTMDMALWRFNANGTVDTSFNKSGVVVHNIAADGKGDSFGKAIALDTQGRILVTGSTNTTGSATDMAVWRFKTDGTLDTTFNSSNGFIKQNNAAGGNGDDTGNAIAFDAVGKILVAGSSTNIAGNKDMVLWRFNTNGTLDTTFGTNGMVINNGAAGGEGDDSANGIVVDSQGRILVTGSSTNSAGNLDMVVWRLNDNGTLDTTFAAYGIAVHNNAAQGDGDDYGSSVAVDSQDRIIVSGSSKNGTGNYDMVIWRVFP